MIELRGKWALVTGASRGIGKLVSEELAVRGVNLILQSRDKEHTAETEKAYKREYGIEVYSVSADLSDSNEVKEMLKTIDAEGKQPDIIMNNAGVQVAYRSRIYDTPETDYTTSFQVNTIAPMMICYHYIPEMIKKGFGRIVNTTSGITGEPEQGGYSASKAALDKVTADIGTKLDGTDVIISLADPGWCRTDLGGPDAPNAPESAIPGVIVGAFVNDRKSGRLFRASDFYGMTLEQAVDKAEAQASPYNYR